MTVNGQTRHTVLTEAIVLSTVLDIHRWRRSRPTDATIGFVPTMGALHDGHRRLIEESSAANDATVVSIFVNPTQFNVPTDFETYPRTLDRDIDIAKNAGADVIFAPDAEEMYPNGFSSFINPPVAAVPLEGERRPGHFQGVVTIVNKLFNCVGPTTAYFGKKDFQQLAVIRGMVRDLNMDIEIVGVETIRDHDGLALSSRNRLLTPDDRSAASVIPRALEECRRLFDSGERDAEALEGAVHTILEGQHQCRVEYATVCDSLTFVRRSRVDAPSVLCIACHFGSVRLIDNLELTP